MTNLIDMSIQKIENGILVHVFSSEVEGVLLKEWIVRDLDEACDMLDKITQAIRDSKRSGMLLEHRVKVAV